MMLRLLFIVLGLIGFSTNADAQLQSSQAGEFKQAKYFAGFSKPFLSNGTFLLSDEQLLWQVTHPVSSKLLVKNNEVYVESSQGTLVRQAGAAPFIRVLEAVIANDESQLSEQFEVLHSDTSTCTVLAPKEALLATLFSTFELCISNEHVSSVRLNEVSGNYTVLSFIFHSNSQKRVK